MVDSAGGTHGTGGALPSNYIQETEDALHQVDATISKCSNDSLLQLQGDLQKLSRINSRAKIMAPIDRV
jgi:hypothetical protein